MARRRNQVAAIAIATMSGMVEFLAAFWTVEKSTPAREVLAAQFVVDAFFRVRMIVGPLEKVNSGFGVYAV